MDEISLSIEETNKLRISLGLKPLKESSNSREVIVDPKLNVISSPKTTQLPSNSSKILKRTKTLGQGKEESVGDFLKKVGKKAKRGTSTKDKKPKVEEYDQDHLEGLKIAHNLEDLPQETILTLKDQLIGDNEEGEDELENISIKKPQKKKQLNVYEEYEREQLGLEKKLLDKYDEEEEVGFVLGRGGVKVNASKLEDLYDKVAKPGGISLDYQKTEMSDFLDVSFKKKKAKKMKKKKGGMDLEDIQEQKEYAQFENSNKKTDISSFNFVDDYDLHKSLARSRKKNLKLNVIELERDQMEEVVTENQVVISDLTEFVETLSSVPLLKQRDNMDEEVKDVKMTVDTPAKDQDNIDMEVDMDVDMDVDQEPEVSQSSSESDSDDTPVSKGLAGTLSLLASRGDLATKTTSTNSAFSKSPEEILIDVQIKQDFAKYGQDKDWPRRLKELEARRERARIKRLEGYKPNVELLHRDKTGRELTAKEAFKDFAQKFHGVKSGKNKVEKRLRRLKEELEMKKLDGDVAVRVTGQGVVQQEDRLPEKMEKGVIMELPVPGTKPVTVKRKHAAIVEAAAIPKSAPAADQAHSSTKLPAKPAVSPKRGKITFGFGKTKLAPKKLE